MVVQIECIISTSQLFAKSLFIIIITIGLYAEVSAQKTSFSSDIKYVEYLKEKRLYAEAQYVMASIDTVLLSVPQRDSLNFLQGGIFLLSNAPENSIKSLNKVSAGSKYYNTALMANAYNYWHNKQYNVSERLLNKALNSTNDSSLQSLALLMLSANSLLQNHPSKFADYSKMILTSDDLIQDKKYTLNKIYQSKISFHKKSPAVAGVLSAIIPGLGKLYAGKPNEAFGAFIPVASLGLLTYEAYRKGGVGSLGFISFASLFSLFYAGNIWGSIVSVKLRNEDFNNNNEKVIAVNMLVPINRLLR